MFSPTIKCQYCGFLQINAADRSLFDSRGVQSVAGWEISHYSWPLCEPGRSLRTTFQELRRVTSVVRDHIANVTAPRVDVSPAAADYLPPLKNPGTDPLDKVGVDEGARRNRLFPLCVSLH